NEYHNEYQSQSDISSVLSELSVDVAETIPTPIIPTVDFSDLITYIKNM
ncbi:hypothetical protein GJ496_006420, partial [Pomphorhynchus laevis]